MAEGRGAKNPGREGVQHKTNTCRSKSCFFCFEWERKRRWWLSMSMPERAHDVFVWVWPWSVCYFLRWVRPLPKTAAGPRCLPRGGLATRLHGNPHEAAAANLWLHVRPPNPPDWARLVACGSCGWWPPTITPTLRPLLFGLDRKDPTLDGKKTLE